mmetsp:Transcript_33185/g.98606  ORF Transcript_33185/g.98606 Transcript_33185/m.98606 type:complete len:99 (-) Transcript_33185:112-408(-)
MKAVAAVVAMLMLSSAKGLKLSEPGDCKKGEQERFDIMMCKSHMCTDCVLEYCTKQCQAVQLEFPTCRCEAWPAARTSYSGGEFEGKGKFGDVGDYGN